MMHGRRTWHTAGTRALRCTHAPVFAAHSTRPPARTHARTYARTHACTHARARTHARTDARVHTQSSRYESVTGGSPWKWATPAARRHGRGPRARGRYELSEWPCGPAARLPPGRGRRAVLSRRLLRLPGNGGLGGVCRSCRREASAPPVAVRSPYSLVALPGAHLIRRFWEGSALLTSEQRGPLSDRTTSPFAPAVSQRAHRRDKRWRKFRSRHSELFGSSTFRSYEFCYGFPFITKISVAMLPRPTFEFEEASSVLCLEFFQL